MNKNQPGVVLRFQAKKGEGDALFSYVTDLHYTGDPDGRSTGCSAETTRTPT